MGKLVLAAKVTHVPSLMLSEVEGSPLRQARENAVRALRELAALTGRPRREIYALVTALVHGGAADEREPDGEGDRRDDPDDGAVV